MNTRDRQETILIGKERIGVGHAEDKYKRADNSKRKGKETRSARAERDFFGYSENT